MKAPDKIYLEKSLSFPDKFHSQWYKEDVVGNGVEYIRKDLLIEWAKEQSASCDSAGAMKRAYDKLIDKLNSL